MNDLSSMDESQRVLEVATTIAEAIGRRDVGTLSGLLAPGFLLRTPGDDSRDAVAFLQGVERIPGEIVFVRLVRVAVDVEGDSAVATGVQHARVRLDGQEIDDMRPFADWFVKHEGEWRLRLAVDLPASAESR